MDSNTKFTFDDFLLVPEYTENDTRETDGICDAKLFDFDLTVPVLSSPMDTVTEITMMKALWDTGAIGVHHRYCEFSVLENALKYTHGGIAISPSMSVNKIIELYNNYPYTFLVLDVSHGHTKKCLDFCKELKDNGVNNLVSGTTVTREAAYAYLKIGVNVFRIGMGNGSRCTTRKVCGVGYPQASAVQEIYNEFGKDIVIISDGGLKNTGDVVKAISCGANFIMTGYLFSGTKECPLLGQTSYRGMASQEALKGRKKEYFIEGENIEIEPKGSVIKVISEIREGIKHACFYTGVSNYRDLVNVEKIFITNNSYMEGLARK